MTTQDPTPVQVIVGSRIRLPDGRFGTIKYIGQVPPTPGQWYGVEWDDENGGKHDGSLNDVRYFQCSSPTSGSFIRPSPKIIFGTSFLSALHTKYTQNNEPQDTTTLESINQKEKDTKNGLDKGQMYWAGNRNILVETYGFEKITKKQSNLDKLVEVSLVNFDICQADPETDIEATVPRIQELDLSRNLFSNWSTVGKICCGLKDLRILRLNHNRFCPLPPQIDDDLSISTAFRNLQTLSLNHTKIGFGDVARLSQYLPTLIELHLGFNGYNSIKFKGRLSHLNNLEVLNLEHNLLSDWNDVQCFQSLPRLSTLMLQHNKLESILPSGKSEFPNLKTVNLTGNEIKDWSSIDALNTFNSLRELRVKDNPLYGYSSPEISRIQVITRIENLVILNGSEVSYQDFLLSVFIRHSI
ncbi:hypothetical protein BKA69DRAFT_1054885 [Paraphysoderma sedebokerense]|nr:hypothetical protein BKA69DRAFT_1058506 [Paraphysoderma sedebokerense]KAI9144408.1 hypothetical protein BKA69DRAFT_1054885 [Paraphysoderma sedebokerense]